MKIRNGFVSNSSSSSFLVAFIDKPKDVKELHNLMFGTDDENMISSWDKSSYSTMEVAQTVFNDLKNQKPLNKKQILEEISNGYFDGYPEYRYDEERESDLIRKEAALAKKDPWIDEPWKTNMRRAFDKERQEQDRIIDECANKYYKETVSPAFEGKKIFKFTYSDNSGPFESMLEHGDIFVRLPSIRLSHH